MHAILIVYRYFGENDGVVFWEDKYLCHLKDFSWNHPKVFGQYNTFEFKGTRVTHSLKPHQSGIKWEQVTIELYEELLGYTEDVYTKDSSELNMLVDAWLDQNKEPITPEGMSEPRKNAYLRALFFQLNYAPSSFQEALMNIKNS